MQNVFQMMSKCAFLMVSKFVQATTTKQAFKISLLNWVNGF